MAQPLEKLIERLPDASKLRIGREIGRGAWGAVHEGKLSGKPVAVKKIHELLVDGAEDKDTALRAFFEECKRIKDLDHPNVIKFRGVFKDTKLGLVLVMERMNENLRQFLEKRKGKLTMEDQIHICHEITEGVTFLHQRNPPMVHCDLNDKNVMFSFEGVAKIGDFGQSKLKKQDVYLTSTAPGMVSFMPPESLRADGTKYDESLDIFSLGVLFLEIGTQEEPTSNMEGIGTTLEVIRREKDLQKMDDVHPLKPFILLCLSDNRKERPKAAELEMVFPRLNKMNQALLAAGQKTSSKHMKAGADGSRSQLIPLEAALVCVRDEIAGSLRHGSRLTAEFQAERASLEKSKKQLVDKCATLFEQSNVLRQDIEKERTARTEAMEKFERERKNFQTFIKGLNEKLKEKEELLSLMSGPCTDLELSLSQSLHQDQVTVAKPAAKTRHTSDKGSKRSATISRPAESSSMIELREENQRLQSHSIALKAECKRVVLQKQQEMQSMKETLEGEIEVLKGRLALAAGRQTDLHVAPVHPVGDKQHIKMALTDSNAFTGSESKHGPDKYEVSYSSSEVTSNEPINHYKVRLVAGISDASDRHDAPCCEKCGLTFLKKQVKLLWEHRSKCTAAGSTASIKRSRSRLTKSYTMSSTRMAAKEDLPRCKKCGRTFPWEQIQLYWKHTCEPFDITCSPEHSQQQIQSYAPNLGRRRTANGEGPVTVEVRLKNETDGAPYVCQCGKTFTDDQRRQFKMHTWKCSEGVRKGAPGGGRAQTTAIF